MLFSFGLVASHYATAEIFLFIIVGAWLITYFIGKRNHIGTKIRFQFVVIFVVILFSWYIFVGSAANFNNLTNVLDYVYRSTLTSFFDLGARSSPVLMGVGLSAPATSWINFIGRVSSYVTELLLVFGFIFVLLTRKKKGFEKEYVAILVMDIVLLGSNLVFPSFASSFGIQRFYTLVLLSAAPLLVVGIYAISSFLFKSKKETITILLALLILIPFFLFQTGAVYEVFHVESYSIPLSQYRFNWYEYLSLGMIQDSDISGVHWLYASDNRDRQTSIAILGQLS